MKKQPAFQRIQNEILASIQCGTWTEGETIPSELNLASQYSVSRMTVNRAIQNLVRDRVLTRRQGSGTFVAQKKYETTRISIMSIAAEVEQRGNVHSCELFSLAKVKSNHFLAKQFNIEVGDWLFHSYILHFENNQPVQIEERWVNPSVAPEYMSQDFMKITPNEYLVKNVPLEKGEYVVESLKANDKVSEMLKVELNAPCLLMTRRTFSQNQVASLVEMWHPGERYKLAGVY